MGKHARPSPEAAAGSSIVVIDYLPLMAGSTWAHIDTAIWPGATDETTAEVYRRLRGEGLAARVARSTAPQVAAAPEHVR